MLNSRYSETGFSLIELLVGITIVGILFMLGVPSFKSWIQNSQIRTATEVIQNGLELARAEAVRRNTLVRFQLTSTVDNSCALTTANGSWVISLDDPSAKCGNAKLNEAFPVSDAVNNPLPRIIQIRSGREGSANTVVASQEVTPTGGAVATPVYNGSITFNGMGRISSTTTPASVNAGDNIQIDITNPNIGGACVSAGGAMRCLRVVISSGGLIRSCNPIWSSNPASINPKYDPQGC